MSTYLIITIVLQLLRAGATLSRKPGYVPSPWTAGQLIAVFIFSFSLAVWGLCLLAGVAA